jgi:3-oxoacyl-[acyl-carrier-protein] synthase-3
LNEDVSVLPPTRIIDATASRMNLEESKVLMNIEDGNTTSATLPLVLSDLKINQKKET